MSLNVLYIIDSLTHGGTEKQLVALIEHLDPQRVRPHLCTLAASDALFDELEIPKAMLPFRSFLRPSLLPCLRQLGTLIRKHRIDIVHTFFQDPFLLAALVRPFTGVRLVGSFRDLGFWRTGTGSAKMRVSYPAFSGFIANSQAVKEHIIEVEHLRPERIAVVYNGIDLATIPPRPDLARRGPRIGIVANLNRPVKRVADFIEAAALIREERPDASFVVVGDGELAPSLRTLAVERGVGGATEFTGRIAEALGVIAGLDVGVITSATEGFCNAIVEYMACGVPVVCTNTGGNPELVEDGRNGFLVPVAAPAILARRVLDILADPALAARMGQANAGKIRQSFSLDAMVAAQSGYYERMPGR